MKEMLMLAQVSHYTGGATRGGRSGRGTSSNKGCRNCFYCGEPNHWVMDCPYRTPQTQLTLPTAPPVSSQMEDQQIPQHNH